MYTIDDLTAASREAIEHSFNSAHEFAMEKKARQARLSLEVVEACQMVLANVDSPMNLNTALHVCADLCDCAADASEEHTSLIALRSAVSCRKCSKIARSLMMDLRSAA